ncbi:MAG: hypothetical protein HYV97_07465 [Bdellovibrio sp.]|nr:hypothetical protein [Bdellovibrio sp.]
MNSISVPDKTAKAINEIFDQITCGDINQARALVLELSKKRVPRQHAVRFASAAISVRIPELAYRCIHPFVRGRARSGRPLDTTKDERIYFASAALDLGAFKEALPLQIEEQAGRYRLLCSRPVTLRIWLKDTVPEEAVKGRHSAALRQLTSAFKDREFQATEAAQALGANKRTTLRILNEVLASGVLEKVGLGRNTRYMIKAGA